MYAALWRALPGHPALKAVQLLVLLAVLVVVLFQWVFPAISGWLPFDENTITTGSAIAAAGSDPSAPLLDRTIHFHLEDPA